MGFGHPLILSISTCMQNFIKKILKKAKESKQDPYLLILEYHNSPLPDCNLSPAQLLLSRRTRSVVPITNNLLKPQAIDPKDVQKHIFCSKSLQKKFYGSFSSQMRKCISQNNTSVLLSKFNNQLLKCAQTEKAVAACNIKHAQYKLNNM